MRWKYSFSLLRTNTSALYWRHCAHTPVLLLIDVGIDSLNSSKEQRLSLSRIFIHPNYDRGTKENDIAILPTLTLPKSEQSKYPISDRWQLKT
jgi:hypothetical protein